MWCLINRVKWLARNDRFVIAVHSPDGAVETGLLIRLAEKTPRNLDARSSTNQFL